jgi:3-methyladenine DNA glycosylase Mpg
VICHTDEQMRNCGTLFAEGSNGLIITCGPKDKCDNVLIRGLLTLFGSQPAKAMHAFSKDGYFGNKTQSKRIDLSGPRDLTADNSPVYITDDSKLADMEPIASLRVGLEDKSDKLWNFKLFDPKNTDTIDASVLKSLNK